MNLVTRSDRFDIHSTVIGAVSVFLLFIRVIFRFACKTDQRDRAETHWKANGLCEFKRIRKLIELHESMCLDRDRTTNNVRMRTIKKKIGLRKVCRMNKKSGQTLTQNLKRSGLNERRFVTIFEHLIDAFAKKAATIVVTTCDEDQRGRCSVQLTKTRQCNKVNMSLCLCQVATRSEVKREIVTYR